MDAKQTSFVIKIDATQAAVLERLLRERGWAFAEAPYARWRAAGDKVQIVAYESGKLTVQGKNAAEFVEFTLEPEILGGLLPGSTETVSETTVDCTPHGGIDESGKGDFFGPLVIAGVCTDAESAPYLVRVGVCDSKLIKSATRIRQLAAEIRRAVDGAFTVVTVGPESYNRLYAKIGNLNRLLAWGHARVIENLLERRPECPRMLSDQFTAAPLIRRALLEKGRQVEFDQRTRAESDVAVAAASILAREQFLNVMEKLGKDLGVTLPRGAGPAVGVAAREIVRRHGVDALERCAKMHFKTCVQILGESDGNR